MSDAAAPDPASSAHEGPMPRAPRRKPSRRPAARRPASRHSARRRPAPRRTPGLRNASDGEVALSTVDPGGDVGRAPLPLSLVQRLTYATVGTGAAALTGALAARWGFHPRTIAIVLGAAGAATVAKFRAAEWQYAGVGAFGAGASQLALMALQKAEDAKDAKDSKDSKDAKDAKDSKDAPPKEPARRQGAALPHGALDAAFERARASVALENEGHDYYTHGYPAY